jgi:ribonuclease P protein component
MAAPFWHAVAPRAVESSFHKTFVDGGRLTGDSAARQRLTLPAQKRIRRKSDFDAAYAKGRRLGNGFFGVTAVQNETGSPRLGLAVAVRVAGGGVQRNRIRRIIRESFRLHQHELPAVDIIVSMRDRARGASGAELRESLSALWKSVAGKFDPSATQRAG